MVRFGIGDDSDGETSQVSPSKIADRLTAVPLAAVTPDRLHDCLLKVVGSARYWQEPEGRDVLAATAELAAPLRRVAAHIATSPHVAWWSSPVDMRGQWQVDWDNDPPRPIPSDPAAVLRRDRESTVAAERAALQDRPADPAAPYSGEWWSNPPREFPATTRLLAGGAPAGLWFVEDDLGWERATSWRLGAPDSLRIYVIDSADAWAALCARFPREVAAQKRHDWYRTTGRAGDWVVPDWVGVAEHYDAVHLQVAGYLEAAGTTVAVDARYASVIAGWGPDTTFWFSDRVRWIRDRVGWVLREG